MKIKRKSIEINLRLNIVFCQQKIKRAEKNEKLSSVLINGDTLQKAPLFNEKQISRRINSWRQYTFSRRKKKHGRGDQIS